MDIALRVKKNYNHKSNNINLLISNQKREDKNMNKVQGFKEGQLVVVTKKTTTTPGCGGSKIVHKNAIGKISESIKDRNSNEKVYVEFPTDYRYIPVANLRTLNAKEKFYAKERFEEAEKNESHAYVD
jgi:hypothetical protein